MIEQLCIVGLIIGIVILAAISAVHHSYQRLMMITMKDSAMIEDRLIDLLERWQSNIDIWLDSLYERRRAKYTPVVPSGKRYYLRPDGDDNADGLSYGTAWRTLSIAEKRLQSGDVIMMGSGLLFYGDIRITGSDGKTGL